ncbi:Putative auto-transporter adhesin, head GIN domain [Sphingomonas guangdongensis]|uniref:Auto-transporter adhesin, head GIN domain n=1 Tax=Sphingomonas guangdongensis TaxID=1141890 RepID=A0A285QBS9_9SPHN|nr:head GIN domain-containing protein [Sphingomonas guangdongensis]SOB78899.1 Putative auto-transporter adhesin, head GIN domain [Sphingomonas guangdongensis]
MIRALPLLALLLPTAGPAEERPYMVTGFDRIRVEGPFEVRVTTGAPVGASASGAERSLDGLSVRASGRTLVVSRSSTGWGGYPGERPALPVVTVRTTLLRSATVLGGGRVSIDRVGGQTVDLAVSGAGELSVGTVAADRLTAAVIGSGALTLGGAAQEARFQSNGPARIDAGALRVRDLTVYAQGTGDGRYAAERSASVNAVGQGSVTIAGTPACKIAGDAPITCGAPR